MTALIIGHWLIGFLLFVFYIIPALILLIGYGIPKLLDIFDYKDLSIYIEIPLFIFVGLLPIINIIFIIHTLIDDLIDDYEKYQLKEFWKSIFKAIQDYLPAIIPLLTLFGCLLFL